MKNIKFMIASLIFLNSRLISCMENKNRILSEGEKYRLGWKLSNAAKLNNLIKIKKLISKGADIEFIDEDYNRKFTPLICAVNSNKKEAVELLLKYGTNVNANDKDGNTPLIIASSKNFIEIAKLLIINKANINDKNDYQYTALLTASSSSSKEIVEILLNYDANIKISDTSTTNPLMRASFWGHKDIVKLLLKNGSDVNKIIDGSTALQHAINHNRFEVTKLIKIFIELNKKYSPELIKFIENNDKINIKQLLKKNIYLIDFNDGNNALHMASRINNPELFKFIISIRPEYLNNKNYDGKRPLDLNPEMHIHLALNFFKK